MLYVALMCATLTAGASTVLDVETTPQLRICWCFRLRAVNSREQQAELVAVVDEATGAKLGW
jgi:hypothetical protein